MVAILPVAVLEKCADPSLSVSLYGKILSVAARAVERGAHVFDPILEKQLHLLPDPHRALVHLDRFLESTFSPTSLLEDFVRYPHLLEIFLRLVSVSGFLADVLVRDPELFRWLTTSGVFLEEKSQDRFLTEAREAFERFSSPERRLNALKRYQRRELLRIASRDILEEPPLAVTVRELSWLAEAILDVLLTESLAIVSQRYGHEYDCPITIIGLGKLGGEELNYSSDIDLMVVYEADRELSPSLFVHDLSVRIVEHLIRLLTEITDEGMLYRTDFRLRPDGGAGALALSLPATLSYYESRGAMWERQMLLKARVVAGDREFGDRVLREILPFRFPRFSAPGPTEVLADVRGRLAEGWERKRSVKHFKGGIRTIEFSIQALQLITGAALDQVRKQGSLPALVALFETGVLKLSEKEAFEECYSFLRRTEHLLQLESFAPTHELPAEEGNLDNLAWKIGLESGEEFRKKLETVREQVIRMSEAILLPGRGGNAAETQKPDSQLLESFGFRYPSQALRLLSDIESGRGQKPHSVRLRQRIRQIHNDLVRDLSKETLPDTGIQSIELLINSAPSPESIVHLLEAAGSRRFLMRLCSSAPVQIREISRIPIVLDAVFGGWAHTPGRNLSLSVRKHIRETAVLGEFLLDELSFENYAREISRIADELLTELLESLQIDGIEETAIIALGKHGGRELVPGSDLDVLFVHDGSGAKAAQEAQKRVLALMEAMRESGTLSPLYTVDARLRPEGRNSPLSVSFDAYCEYLFSRASLWEKQSLLKARMVFGDSKQRKKILDLYSEVFSRIRVTPDTLDEILSMRRKMEPVNRFRARDFFDVKLSSGGLADAEFAVQAAQLLHGPDTPCVLGENTFSAFKDIRDHIPSLKTLLYRMEMNYRFLRRLVLFFRILIDTPSNLLPVEENQLKPLASIAGAGSTVEFLQEVQRKRKEMRSDLMGVMSALKEHAGKP